MNEAITVVGSLGGDPTLKSVNGDQVAEFRLACTARRKDGDVWVDGHTNWFSIEAWGGFADHIGASLHKGDVVMVLGKLKVDQWESGDKRGTSIKIRAEHIGHSLRVGPALRQRKARPAEQGDDPAVSERDALAEARVDATGSVGAPEPDHEPMWAEPAAASSFGT
ncbi:single-stranded DNA-binding protein [Agrococcus sp. ARC_14]|uniref:single-stranded DNA-binding protein n=1 Tax=Agrococcus sp. ARC_14 TaxID=2919927 RepID=UPI001F05EABB|nr:single-stranded DNA-binding protein [Agrococcus sp. ARC_14]MCH1882916.1 single-stranded DNA-binding protein [Agrococcus sp. ARC_14]